MDHVLGLISTGKFDRVNDFLKTLDPESFEYKYLNIAYYAALNSSDMVEKILEKWENRDSLNEVQSFFLELILFDISMYHILEDYQSRISSIEKMEENLNTLEVSREAKSFYQSILNGYKGIASLHSGLYRNAESILSSCISSIQPKSTFQKSVQSLLKIALIDAKIELGKFESARLLSESLQKETARDGNILGHARSSIFKGYAEFLTGNRDRGLNELIDSLEYVMNNGLPAMDLGLSYLLTAKVYLAKGEFNVAKRFLLSAIESFESYKDLRNLARCYSELGLIYYEQGILDSALESFQKSLASNLKLGNQLKIAIDMKDIATVNHTRLSDSNYGQYLHLALEQAKKVGHAPLEAELCYYIVTNSEIDSPPSKEALDTLAQISHERPKSSEVTILYLLAKSYILKNSNRIIDKFAAQQTYFEIIENTEIHSKFMVDAYLALFELLLLELKISSESGEEVMDDIRRISTKLESYLKSSGSMSVRLKLMILRSKILLLEQKLDASQKILLEAEELAITKGFYYLKQKITNERNALTSYIAKWMKVIEKNKENIENYQRKKIIEYLNEASKVVEMF